MFVASLIYFGACTETIAETVEGCHAYGELQFSREAPPGWAPEQVSGEELLFVVEKPLRGSVEHIIREAVDSFAHPNYGDAWLNDFVMSKMTRVFVIDRSELGQVLPALRCTSLPPNTCPTVELPFAEFYSPGYGFGTTNEEFAAKLSCLLSGNEQCRSQSGVGVRAINYADIVWISDHDSCAEAGDGCEALQQLLTFQAPFFLVVPAPASLDLEQPSGAVGGRPSQALAALQAHDVSTECAGLFPDAHAPRALLESAVEVLGVEDDYAFVVPLCRANVGALLTHSIASTKRWDVLSFFSYFQCSDKFRRLASDEDGFVPCTLTETLPSVGPVTQCSQLADRGRELLSVSAETGRETCLIQQTPIGDAMVQDGQGYTYGKATLAQIEALELKLVCAQYDPRRSSFYVPEDFTTIPGSSSRIVCTSVDEPAPACRSKQPASP